MVPTLVTSVAVNSTIASNTTSTTVYPTSHSHMSSSNLCMDRTLCDTPYHTVRLNNSNVVSICKGNNFAAVFLNNDCMAVVRERRHSVPEVYKVMTGWLCAAVYENPKYGGDCFRNAVTGALIHILPMDGDDIHSFHTIFDGHSRGTYDGQDGVCFTGLNRLETFGLTQYAQINLRSARDGEVMRCKWRHLEKRIFIGTIWVLVALIPMTFMYLGLTLAATLGIVGSSLCFVIMPAVLANNEYNY